MHNIAAHPVQNASTNHKYITPLGHEISNLAVYHSTLSEYQKRTPFTGTLFFLAVDKRDITVPLTYVGGHWKKNNPDGIHTDFSEGDESLVYLFFGVGEHCSGGTHTYKILSTDTARFTEFIKDERITL